MSSSSRTEDENENRPQLIQDSSSSNTNPTPIPLVYQLPRPGREGGPCGRGRTRRRRQQRQRLRPSRPPSTLPRPEILSLSPQPQTVSVLQALLLPRLPPLRLHQLQKERSLLQYQHQRLQCPTPCSFPRPLFPSLPCCSPLFWSFLRHHPLERELIISLFC